MHPFKFELLSFLAPNSTFQKEDILPLLTRLFPKPEKEAAEVSQNVKAFIKSMRDDGFIIVDAGCSVAIETFYTNPEYDDGIFIKYYQLTIMASITEKGLNELKEHQLHENNRIASQSVIETNSSIITTNQSIQKMNEIMSDISERQLIINKSIADNSVEQTSILMKQSRILVWSVSAAVASALIAGISLYESIRQDKLQTQLDNLSKELQAQKSSLNQSKTHVILDSAAKKNASKKKP